jgi:hypothetical protein
MKSFLKRLVAFVFVTIMAVGAGSYCHSLACLMGEQNNYGELVKRVQHAAGKRVGEKILSLASAKHDRLERKVDMVFDICRPPYDWESVCETVGEVRETIVLRNSNDSQLVMELEAKLGQLFDPQLYPSNIRNWRDLRLAKEKVKAIADDLSKVLGGNINIFEEAQQSTPLLKVEIPDQNPAQPVPVKSRWC